MLKLLQPNVIKEQNCCRCKDCGEEWLFIDKDDEIPELCPYCIEDNPPLGLVSINKRTPQPGQIVIVLTAKLELLPCVYTQGKFYTLNIEMSHYDATLTGEVEATLWRFGIPLVS